MESKPGAAPSARFGDGGDQTENALDGMERHEFVRSVRRAEADAAKAAEVRDGMLLWAKRLLPFLDRDPHMTLATALLYYRAAQVTALPVDSARFDDSGYADVMDDDRDRPGHDAREDRDASSSEDETLDEQDKTLADSFPASDPPAMP